MAEASKSKTGEQGPTTADTKAGVSVRLSLSERLEGLPGKAGEHEGFTIFRLPASIRQCAPNLHKPSMVAIGPYHRDDKDLRAMEAHKLWYLRELLSRLSGTSWNWKERLEMCVRVIGDREARARRCYAEDFDLCSEEFVEMLVVDGCFIIELLYKVRVGDWETMLRPGWSLNLIRSDLIMLENQIPFWVLDVLYNLLLDSEPDCSQVYRRSFFLRMLAAEALTIEEMKAFPDPISNCDDFQHLLHLHYACCMPFPRPWEKPPPVRCDSLVNRLIVCFCAVIDPVHRHFLRIVSWLDKCDSWAKVKEGFFWLCPCLRFAKPPRTRMTIPCATELWDAGVRFRQKVVDVDKAKQLSSLLEISFDSRGNLEIPWLEVYDDTKPLLINLVAFEQCNGAGVDKMYFTSYVFLMDGLVNTEKDVAVLRRCEVLENYLSSDEELAEFFNQLSKFMVCPERCYFYHNLVKSVLEYYGSKWHRWRANLIRDYFSNPWSFFSLGAAIFLLILTVAQTILAFFAYFRPPS